MPSRSRAARRMVVIPSAQWSRYPEQSIFARQKNSVRQGSADNARGHQEVILRRPAELCTGRALHKVAEPQHRVNLSGLFR